jgi:secreted trypsin-like serine protease
LKYVPPAAVRRKRSPKSNKKEQKGTTIAPSQQDNDGDIYHVTFVGGVKAEYNEFPHMTAIGWKRDSQVIDWLCGGSLISENFVLSAGHCASVGREAPDVVRIGDQDLTVNETGIAPQEIDIKNIIVHPQYKHTLKYHDLALFELVNPIT